MIYVKLRVKVIVVRLEGETMYIRTPTIDLRRQIILISLNVFELNLINHRWDLVFFFLKKDCDNPFPKDELKTHILYGLYRSGIIF